MASQVNASTRITEKKLPYSLFQQKLIGTSDGIGDRVELLLRPSEPNGINIGDYLSSLAADQKIQVFRHLIDLIILHQEALSDTEFSINVTPEDILHPDFIQELERLGQHFNTTHIVLEIVEKKIQQGREKELLDTLSTMKDIGFQISVDDLGAQNSDFRRTEILMDEGYLDEIKLDMKVFGDLYTSRNSGQQSINFCGEEIAVSKILKAIKAMKQLGTRIVVEGIESENQAKYANEVLGADMLQGYHLHKAEPVNTNLLESGVKRGGFHFGDESRPRVA